MGPGHIEGSFKQMCGGVSWVVQWAPGLWSRMWHSTLIVGTHEPLCRLMSSATDNRGGALGGQGAESWLPSPLENVTWSPRASVISAKKLRS